MQVEALLTSGDQCPKLLRQLLVKHDVTYTRGASGGGYTVYIPPEVSRDKDKMPTVYALQIVAQLLQSCLKEAGINTELPDSMLDAMSAITGQAATSGGIRDHFTNLMLWRSEATRKLRPGHTFFQILALTSAVYYLMVVRILSQHAVPAQIGKEKIHTFGNHTCTLGGPELSRMGWTACIMSRYKLFGEDTAKTDVASFLPPVTGLLAHQAALERGMTDWREKCDVAVREAVPAEHWPFADTLLSSFALRRGCQAYTFKGKPVSQAFKTSQQILQRSAETQAKTTLWYNAFTVGLKQLETFDGIHGTDLAERADEAWVGTKALSTRNRAHSRLRSIKEICGRTIPFSLLFADGGCPSALLHFTILLHPCCTYWWITYLPTNIVWSAIDAGFAGYVRFTGKSGANHCGALGATASVTAEVMQARTSAASMAESELAISASQSRADLDLKKDISEPEQEKVATILSKQNKQSMLATQRPFLQALRKTIEAEVLNVTRGGMAKRAPFAERSLAPWWTSAEWSGTC